jgi:hypothetical protein
MTNNAYNVNIYYNEEEVHSAFQHYFNDVKLNSVVHVFSKNSAPFEKYMHEENVLMYDSGNFFDKIRNWLAGETQFEDQFAHLNVSDVDRKKFNKIINNGGTIVISNAAFNTSSTYKPDMIANREMFQDDFDYPTAAGIHTMNPIQRDQLEERSITSPDDPMYQATGGTLEEDFTTNRESFPTEADENDVAFQPIQQDEASQLEQQIHTQSEVEQYFTTNRESFPYPVNAEDRKSEKTYGLQYNSERKDFGMPENARAENLKFNPIQKPLGKEEKSIDPHFTAATASHFDPLTDTNKESFNTDPNGAPVDFQPIEQDLGSQESVTSTNQLLNEDAQVQTNKASFPFESRDAQTNLDQVETASIDASTEQVNPLDELTEEEQRFFDESPAVNENYDLQFNEQQSTSTGVTYERYSQELSPHETISTFDAISSRNHHPADYEAELAQQETTQHLNPFTYTEDGSFTEQLPVDDTLHRSDEFENEQDFTAFLDDENPSILRDDTLGKASEFRRHDLP